MLYLYKVAMYNINVNKDVVNDYNIMHYKSDHSVTVTQHTYIRM